MTSWKKGQRVLSQTEPELGLGVVSEIVDRSALEVFFDASNVRRRYASKNAPLRRFTLDVGQSVQSKTGIHYKISEVTENAELFLYKGEGHEFWEYELSSQLQDLGALDQFMLGQWTPHKAFDLRKDAWKLKANSLHSHLRGLAGPRVKLLAHQLYIAQEVSKRDRPRALLADEVGLGKTIEAGLIFSSLRALGRARRVLILVPESLTHQWLAELYRRFNTLFSVATDDSESFSSEQLWIVPTKLLLSDLEKLNDILNESWDLVIVDEAHHLKWNSTAPDSSWKVVKEISLKCEGLLLLTATPRQQGLETQFGLLHLVDPERFSDFEAFKNEASEMFEVATLARALEQQQMLPETLEQLKKRFPKDPDLAKLIDKVQGTENLSEVFEALVDRHGTGRVLFRNRRERLKGFPKRKLFSYALKAKTAVKNEWLLDFIEKLNGEKALILCSTHKQLNEIKNYLDKHSGIKKAVFHENLDLLERDKQAAWFAQPRGAQILISSEVGGEGRNFQFCHKLVLFDLPSHPDLLEQRIGRLDRIGQGFEIEIHVPWMEQSRDEVLFSWYHQGLNSFEHSWNGLAAIEEKLREPLTHCLENFSETALEALLAQTQSELEAFKREQQDSIDLLLDFNSFNPKVGQLLLKNITENEDDESLQLFMEKCWDYFGIDQDDFNAGAAIKVSPSSLMYVQNFPELEDEKVVTFSRKMALEREDFTFLTQEHAMVQGALTLMLDQNLGTASAAMFKGKNPGLYFEFVFILQATADASLEIERFLPPQVVHLVMDSNEKQIAQPYDPSQLKEIPEAHVSAFTSHVRDIAQKLFAVAHLIATEQSKTQIAKAFKQADESLEQEVSRLSALQKINPSIKESELAALKIKKQKILETLSNTDVRLDALRSLWSPN